MTDWTNLLGGLTSHPAAFLTVPIYAGLWGYFSPATFHWFAVASLTIWGMTLLIQQANRRNALAVHAKLDELLNHTRQARKEAAGIAESEPQDIERVPNKEQSRARKAPYLRPVK